MNRRTLTLVLAGAAGPLLLLVVWATVAPATLGGAATYVITQGSSMEPGVQRGDLVVLRAHDAYRVGDVVAYRSRDLKRTVLHRIVARDGTRFVLKGDNNNWVDPEKPRRSDLLGKRSLVIPRLGHLLAPLQAPRNAALVAGLVAFLAAGGLSTGKAGVRSPEPAGSETP